MSNRLQITPGNWISYYSHISNTHSVKSINIIANCVGVDTELTKQCNAQLIADAGTTYNKCGKTAGELLEERDNLVSLLKEMNRIQCRTDSIGMAIINAIEKHLKP